MKNILIVGSGMLGLTTAIRLADQGHDVEALRNRLAEHRIDYRNVSPKELLDIFREGEHKKFDAVEVPPRSRGLRSSRTLRTGSAVQKPRCEDCFGRTGSRGVNRVENSGRRHSDIKWQAI